MRNNSKTEKIPMRMDFVSELIRSDDETHTAHFLMKPDPRRYIDIENDGKRMYFDKYLKTAIPADELYRAAKSSLHGIPIFYNPPTVRSAIDYAAERRKALGEELSGSAYVVPKQAAIPHGNVELGDAPRNLTFLSVDICSSSGLRRKNEVSFEAAYKIFLRELGTIVGQFNGRIHKTTGDGFIAYIDSPAFVTQCDNTVDMGLTLIGVLHHSINPALEESGLPPLNIRIGAEFGMASVRVLDIPATGYSTTEIASNALNRAVKIEQSADDNELRIGRALYELIHVQWLERSTEVDFDAAEVGLDEYKVYSVR
jgi:class 3 adenylate cyclase